METRDDLYFAAATYARRALFKNGGENAECLYLLGKLHENGYAVDRNEALSLAYYQRAAHNGHQKALLKVANYQYS